MRNTGDMIGITDEEIKASIRDYAEKKRLLAESLLRVRRDLRDLEEDLYATVAMPEADLSEGRSELRREDPMVPMILRKERELRQYRREFQMRIAALEGEMLRMERIHMAYQLLPWRHRRVLEKLYQDRRPWKGLAEELGMTKTTLVRLRAEAFRGIRETCDRVACAAEVQTADRPEGYAAELQTAYEPEGYATELRTAYGPECSAVAEDSVFAPEEPKNRSGIANESRTADRMSEDKR